MTLNHFDTSPDPTLQLSFDVALSGQESTKRFPEGITIQVIALEAPLSNYRTEVAGVDMNLWIREEFELPVNNVGAAFDSMSGDYEFRWYGEEYPFSDLFTRNAVRG